jgi:RNA-directed DNA polymerase
VSARNNLFLKICDSKNIIDAYFRARKGLCDKTEGDLFAEHLELHAFEMGESLRRHAYAFGPYRLMRVRDPKERTIFVAPFRDRIMHHAINWQIEPIFEPTFIENSFACRKGKGNLQAIHLLQAWLNGMPDTFVLQLDIRKYFASVDRRILLDMIYRKIHDRDVRKMVDRLICTAPSESGEGKGLPIGNLTSQTFANLYLNRLDHFAKDYLGVRHYIRYVDDIIALGNKKSLHDLRARLKDFLYDRLDLTVAPRKDKVLAAKNGIPFLGFVLRPRQRPNCERRLSGGSF